MTLMRQAVERARMTAEDLRSAAVSPYSMWGCSLTWRQFAQEREAMCNHLAWDVIGPAEEVCADARRMLRGERLMSRKELQVYNELVDVERILRDGAVGARESDGDITDEEIHDEEISDEESGGPSGDEDANYGAMSMRDAYNFPGAIGVPVWVGVRPIPDGQPATTAEVESLKWIPRLPPFQVQVSTLPFGRTIMMNDVDGTETGASFADLVAAATGISTDRFWLKRGSGILYDVLTLYENGVVQDSLVIMAPRLFGGVDGALNADEESGGLCAAPLNHRN